MSWCVRFLSRCVRLQPAPCRVVVVYSRSMIGASRLCVVALSFTLVLCPDPARYVSRCCRLPSFCVRLQPALCRGAVVYLFCVRHQQALCRGVVVYSRFFLCAAPATCVAVLSFTIVLCPTRSALWCCRLVSFCVRLQPVLCRGASWTIIV